MLLNIHLLLALIAASQLHFVPPPPPLYVIIRNIGRRSPPAATPSVIRWLGKHSLHLLLSLINPFLASMSASSGGCGETASALVQLWFAWMRSYKEDLLLTLLEILGMVKISSPQILKRTHKLRHTDSSWLMTVHLTTVQKLWWAQKKCLHRYDDYTMVMWLHDWGLPSFQPVSGKEGQLLKLDFLSNAVVVKLVLLLDELLYNHINLRQKVQPQVWLSIEDYRSTV